MALPALADEHRAAAPLLLCAGACCRVRVLRRAAIDRYPLYIRRASKQQARSSGVRIMMKQTERHAGTDRQTDTRQLHRPWT